MSFSGHFTQVGCFGVHIVAPSSIRAWLKSPGFEESISWLVNSLKNFKNIPSILYILSKFDEIQN